MLIKPVLLNLEPDTRAFALVGAFMGYFALLEEGVNEALGVTLGIDGARRIIVGRNMGYDDKLKSLRTLIDWFIYDPVERKRFDTMATEARKLGQTRNVIAHSPFRRSEQTDGVEFFAWSATKELRNLEMDWSIDAFLKAIDHINTLDNDIRSIQSKLSMMRIAEALTQNETPREGSTWATSNSLGGLFGLGATLDEPEPQK